jgi:hypothetical protein
MFTVNSLLHNKLVPRVTKSLSFPFETGSTVDYVCELRVPPLRSRDTHTVCGIHAERPLTLETCVATYPWTRYRRTVNKILGCTPKDLG